MTSLQNDFKKPVPGRALPRVKAKRWALVDQYNKKKKKPLGDSTKNVKKHGAKRKSFIFGVGALPKYN